MYTVDGTINVHVPEGTHTISIQYTETMVRGIANIISIASVIGIVVWGILSVRSKTRLS